VTPARQDGGGGPQLPDGYACAGPRRPQASRPSRQHRRAGAADHGDVALPWSGPRRCGIAVVVFVPGGPDRWWLCVPRCRCAVWCGSRMPARSAERDRHRGQPGRCGIDPVLPPYRGFGHSITGAVTLWHLMRTPLPETTQVIFVRTPCDMNAASTPNGLIPAMPWRPARAAGLPRRRAEQDCAWQHEYAGVARLAHATHTLATRGRADGSSCRGHPASPGRGGLTSGKARAPGHCER